ncbi:MAG TPA: hypothetical protein VKC51_00190 [Lacunisphaera sp.]|nr:hypothetical protein [Lacunisphaera sp.]
MTQSWKLILVLVGIFAAGVVTGAFVALRVGREMMARRPMPELWAPQRLKLLAERLDLKPEQLEQIRPIMRRNMEELNRLRTYSMTETRSVFERLQREIAERLTPEQRAKFEQMNREEREKREARDKAERARRANGDRPNDGSRPMGEPGKPPGQQPPPPPDKSPGG